MIVSTLAAAAQSAPPAGGAPLDQMAVLAVVFLGLAG